MHAFDSEALTLCTTLLHADDVSALTSTGRESQGMHRHHLMPAELSDAVFLMFALLGYGKVERESGACSIPWSVKAALCRLQVTGERELAFFPGLARGGIYSGFDYTSEGGSRAAPLTTLPHDAAFGAGIPQTCSSMVQRSLPSRATGQYLASSRLPTPQTPSSILSGVSLDLFDNLTSCILVLPD